VLLEGTLILFIFSNERKGREGNGHDRHDFNTLINQAELLD